MAVNIDDLEVQTQPTVPPATTSQAPPAKRPELDFRAEMDKLHERELRLQAD